ncbi:hypothetical protein HMPREF2975_07525 [Actinomyces sp. HMSC065F12]|nr:hypothetical protein HMPREF2975_07525 [Actinomyces sp. HMSC065F12]
MEADTSLTIKGDGVALAPDTNSHGLIASQGDTSINIPLAPSQMLTVAAWLVDMAAENERTH